MVDFKELKLKINRNKTNKEKVVKSRCPTFFFSVIVRKKGRFNIFLLYMKNNNSKL